MDGPEGPAGPELVVVLAEPRTPGNVGAVARAMANFGLSRLRIVAGVPLDEDSYKRALHAAPILEEARRYDDLEAALAGREVIIAPNSPSPGVRVAFIACSGAPVELLEISGTQQRTESEEV